MEAGTQSYRAKKRVQIAERRAKVSAMYLEERLTQLQIAKKLGCSETVVYEDLQCLQAQWRHDAKLNTEAHIAIQLKTIDENIRWAKEIYEKSRKPLRSATASERHTLDGPETARSATVVERDEGDIRCVAEVRKWEEQRAKILGLFKKDEGKDNDEGNNKDVDEEVRKKLAGMTLEQMVDVVSKEQVRIKAEERKVNGATSKANRPAPAETNPKRLP